ncbi:hypothetical protein DVH24_014889 [Malus domestica]|uniref:At2g29880-like C-terminal domain-containing protein n=1 Tax=Malus domestica TaxID=3750 RepID=A0A498K067_MALDO|nr:hypothetical protein DVH24_014889 [Malus domestica]
MEKKKEEKNNNVWDAIKEIPNLDAPSHYKAVALVQKLGMKKEFLKMTPEEHSEWIKYNMEHNFLRKEYLSDEFPIEPEDDKSEDEENDDELGNQTQEQQRQIANAWRADITTNMWTNVASDSIQR